MRYVDIKTKIQRNYKQFSANQRVLADFFIENFDKVPFLNIQHVSEKTGSSEASVVRFSQRIGFSGYSEMRGKIAEDFQQHLKQKSKFPLLENLDNDTLTGVANTDIQNINQTLKAVDRQLFVSFVEEIQNARRVFVGGLGISFLLSEILAYQLNQVGIDARSLRAGSASFREQALFVDKDDLIVTFSFPPYSEETIELAKYAQGAGITCLAITDRDASPVTFFSKMSLPVKSENRLYTNSFAAISVIINAISTECALRDKARAQEMLNNLNRLSDSK